jgi:O-antigen ligase
VPNANTPTPRALLAIAAAAAPSLLAYNTSPSPTFLNQALAVALWGWFVVAAAPSAGRCWQGAGPLFGALALMTASVFWSWGPGSLPMGLALSAIGLLLATAVLVAGGAGVHSRPDPARAFGDFALGWVVAGVFNVAIAVVQVFTPEWPDGDWIAHSGIVGRAVGNLRQPNHLSSLLVWAAVSVVALVELRRLKRGPAAALLAMMVFGVVLSGSRTGLLSIGLLAVWGLADRRLSRPARWLLLAAPAFCALAWLGMAEWAKLSAHTFGAAARLSETDISGSRYAIWRNTLVMIGQQPWTGVGFGEFNFAWTLTPFPGRPVAFFDHTHNLPLQLAVEIGLPLTCAVLALLGVALWRAVRLAWGDEPGGERELGSARRCALMMVLMIGLHSLLEYPLWYSYFLLPAAWAWAFAVGRPAEGVAPEAGPPSRAVVGCGVALVAGSMLSVLDYSQVTAIFSVAEHAPPLAQRIAVGQRSVLFAHHADYAAATTDVMPKDDLRPFVRATHYLLDTRLMMAWAKALAAHGQVDEARFLAARLREFHNAASDEFFEDCDDAPAATAPFQCQAPQQQPNWRVFQRPVP